MEERRRPKRVANLIKEALSRLLIQEFQDSSSSLITITHVEMTSDLKTARVFLRIFGSDQPENVLALLERRKGFLRKYIASQVKLKYNPTFIFRVDPTPEIEEKIDRLINLTRKDNEEEAGGFDRKKSS